MSEVHRSGTPNRAADSESCLGAPCAGSPGAVTISMGNRKTISFIWHFPELFIQYGQTAQRRQQLNARQCIQFVHSANVGPSRKVLSECSNLQCAVFFPTGFEIPIARLFDGRKRGLQTCR